mgnify:CR=1 FL=1
MLYDKELNDYIQEHKLTSKEGTDLYDKYGNNSQYNEYLKMIKEMKEKKDLEREDGPVP